ncbi:MAG: tetratricopeptide repeat protein [FCB group bacterium]|nr:tetratricopeptide repeat protein [FCB group bacterium]
MMDDNEKDSGRFWIVILSVTALLTGLIRSLPFLFPDGRLWGVNHLLFIDSFWTVLLGAGLLLALLTCVSPIRERVSGLFDRVGRLLFDEGSYLRWLFTGFILLPLFWFLRMPTNLLGDGYTVINNIADDIPVVFKWSEIGAVTIVHYIASLLPIEGLARGEYAFAIVSVFSGAVTVFFFSGLAYELGQDSIRRLAAFCLLLFSGWTLLFFGYAENYPLLWPFVTGYLYFGLRYIRGQNSLIGPTILILIAALLHLQTVFFLVSYPLLLVARGKGRSFFQKHTKLLLIAAGFVVLSGLAAFVYKYLTAMEFMIHFLPPFSGRPPTTDYAVFSPTHLLDILNELSLLIPVWPILLLTAIWGRRDKSHDAVDFFLLAFSAGGIILLFILDPRIGMGRDWDLFALTGLGPLLYLLRRSFNSSIRIDRLWPGIALLSLVLILPYFATNLSYQPSIEYVKSLLHLDMPKSKPGLAMIRDYYRNEGDKPTGDSLNHEILINFPLIRIADEIHTLVKSGRTDRALVMADSVFKTDPYSAETHNILGMVHFNRQEYDLAIRYYMQSMRLKPYDPRPMSNIASSYQQLGKADSMMTYLHKAEKLSPNSSIILEGLAMAYFSLREFDTSYHYAERLLKVDSLSPLSYLAAGLSSFGRGDKKLARQYLQRYVDMTPDSPNKRMAQKTLDRIDE